MKSAKRATSDACYQEELARANRTVIEGNSCDSLQPVDLS